MSLMRHLHLDEVITSFPELGPTVPDGGYSWIVLLGIFLIQMTVPSILSMYGVVLGYLYQKENVKGNFDIWEQKIILTPILFVGFWNLADPWTKTIVNMASIPRLVGLIGVLLLSLGVIASGYLATGGVGAYFASVSAGAVMGIGASFVILQSAHVLRKYFRRRLLLALTLKNVGASLGLISIPHLTYLLLMHTGLKLGLLFMTIVFFPTAIGIITLRAPIQQRPLPYRLLLSAEEDNELPIRVSSDMTKETQDREGDDGLENPVYREDEDKERSILFDEGNNIFAYQEPEEDVDLFVSPVTPTTSKWKQQLRVFKSFKFWIALMGLTGTKMSALLFWILLPVLFMRHSFDWVFLSIIAGLGTFLPSIASYKVLNLKSQYRRIYFGLACWSGCSTLLGLNYASNYTILVACAFFGGTSISAIFSCQDLALYDIFGLEIARHSYRALYSLMGVGILLPSLAHDTNFYIQLATVLQFIGGIYWISSSVFEVFQAGKSRSSHTTSRTNREQT